MKAALKITLIGLSGLMVSLAQPVLSASTSFSEYAATGQPPLATTPTGTSSPTALSSSVTTYSTAAAFNLAAPGTTLEDFSATLVPPNSVGSPCGPVNSVTATVCFNAGGVAPGFSLNAAGLAVPNDVAVITTGFLGVSSTAVGPNAFSDNMIIDFTQPNHAVAFRLITPFGDESVVIEVFNAANVSMGTTTVTGSLAGTFIGFTSPLGISRIETAGANTGDEAEVISDLQFGPVSYAPVEVPALSTASMLGLILLLTAGAFVFSRRKLAV